MKLYHGSSELFTEFKIGKELAKHDPDAILPEGLGIYMTSNEKIAEAYGSYIYHVEVDKVLDFTKIKEIRRLYLEFSNHIDELLNIDISELLIYETISRVIADRLSIMNIIKESIMINEEHLLFTFELLNIDYYEVTEKIESEWLKYLDKGVIRYIDNSLGVVYIAKDTSLLKIKKIEGVDEKE